MSRFERDDEPAVPIADRPYVKPERLRATDEERARALAWVRRIGEQLRNERPRETA